jgi:hypothetical protein
VTRRRRLILLSSLVVAAALSLQSLLWTPEQAGPGALPDFVQAGARAHAATIHPSEAPTASSSAPGRESVRQGDSLQLHARAASSRPPRDLFAAYSWQPPAPPPPAPPPPQAPPLPFAYGGRIEVDGKQVYLLLQGVRTYRVMIGDSVGEFVLKSSGPEELVFLHQPTGQSEVLPAPGVSIAAN